jgi:hypothetical protein
MKTGQFNTEDEDHPGRPFVVTVPGNVDAMHDMILQIGKFQPKDISGTCRVHHP